jgi:hypothetical protein
MSLDDALQSWGLSVTEYIAQMDPRAIYIVRAASGDGVDEQWEQCKMQLADIAPRADGETVELSRSVAGRIVKAETSKIALRFATGQYANGARPDSESDSGSDIKQRVVLIHPAGDVCVGLMGNGYDIGTIDKVDLDKVELIIMLIMSIEH